MRSTFLIGASRALALVAMVLALPCRAQWTAYGDLWWVPEESGWGVGIHHQGHTIFATLFVYDANRRPTWYVASDMRYVPAFEVPSDLPVEFSGTLYETTGPGFGAPFAPAAVGVTAVGTARLRFHGLDAATLDYQVGAVSVVKAIRRQTFAIVLTPDGFPGTRLVERVCDGVVSSESASGRINVSQSGSDFSFDFVHGTPAANCRHSGTLWRAGRLARVEGTHYCVSPGGEFSVGGQFRMTLLEGGIHGFDALIEGTDGACRFKGRLGGVIDITGMGVP